MSAKKPGRNDPCPCGSGKKYKACHAGMDKLRDSLDGRMQARDINALVQYAEGDPAVKAHITQEAVERAKRVEEALRQSTTPSVFAPEEQVWLTCVLWEPLNALKTPGLVPAARREAIASFLRSARGAMDADFLQGLVERLRTLSQDTTLPEATRAFYTDAAVAFEAEPVRMALAAVLTGSNEPVGRWPEELVALADLEALPRWKAEDLDAYRQLLEGRGMARAAARVKMGQEWLRTHSVQLDTPKA